jgi:hypothetical protein
MTALTQDRKTDRVNPEDSSFPLLLTPTPVEANTNVFAGAMVAYNSAGNIVPASVIAGLRIVGRAEFDALNNPGTAGLQQVMVRPGAYYYNNGTGGDVIANANIGQPCYASDDNTVNLTDGGVFRPVAGTILGLNPNGNGQVGVLLGYMWPGAGGFLQKTTVNLPLATIQAQTSGTAFNVGPVWPTGYRLLATEVVVTTPISGGGIASATMTIQGAAATGDAAGAEIASFTVFTGAKAINAPPGSSPYASKGGQQTQATITASAALSGATAGVLAINFYGAIIN